MSIDLPGWPDSHPPEALRAETEAMSDAWTEVLTQRLGPGVLRGVYRKGSAQKRWDTRIDYVPELSDVDIHVAFARDEDIGLIDSVDEAIEINEAVLAAYCRRVPRPHVPKPQFVVANQLDKQPDIMPSPAATVVTLLGEPYVDRTLTDDERATQRARSREQLTAHRAFIEALPLRIIDRPGRLATGLIGEMNWRLSPIAPRVLEVLGEPYEEVWSLNRTGLVRALEARGLDELARTYASYYLAGWEAFLAGAAGREAGAALPVLRHGVRVIELGAEFAAGLDSASS